MELWGLSWGSFSRGFLDGFEEGRLSPGLEREVRGRDADQVQHGCGCQFSTGGPQLDYR